MFSKWSNHLFSPSCESERDKREILRDWPSSEGLDLGGMLLLRFKVQRLVGLNTQSYERERER